MGFTVIDLFASVALALIVNQIFLKCVKLQQNRINVDQDQTESMIDSRLSANSVYSVPEIDLFEQLDPEQQAVVGILFK